LDSDYKNSFGNLSITDSLSSTSQPEDKSSKKDIDLNFDHLQMFGNLKQLDKNYYKNLKTSDTSSELSDTDSFELEIEYVR
jgi:hypothetical protein